MEGMLYMIIVMITDIPCLSGCLFLTETFDQYWKSGVLLPENMAKYSNYDLLYRV